MMQLSKYSKRYAWLTSKMQKVSVHPLFVWLTTAIIILTVLLIGFSTYSLSSHYINQLGLLDYWITSFFVVEIIIRFLAAGNFRKFFSRRWNVFDLLIILGSLLPIEDNEYVLLGRLFRVFRTLLLFNAVPQLNLILGALWASIPRIGYIGLMLLLIFYIFGVFGSLLFGHIDPSLWGNVGVAMLTLLLILTDSWATIMYETMEHYPWSWLYYLLFIFLSGAIFVNMLIGVLIDAMQHQMKDKSAPSSEKGKDNR